MVPVAEGIQPAMARIVQAGQFVEFAEWPLFDLLCGTIPVNVPFFTYGKPLSGRAISFYIPTPCHIVHLKKSD